MNFKNLLTIGLFLVSSNLPAFSQAPNNELVEINDDNEVIDSTLSIPDDFEESLDFLLRSWIVERSDSSECQSSSEIVAVSDSILKMRLSQMPCLMEMPFNSTVRSYIELYANRKRSQVEYMMGMSSYYFPIFEEILGANNLPLELKYLPVIESALNTTIVSHMGAAGLWQFMIATGKMYGLEINSLVDERLSPVKATKAAAHFLKDLYSIYGDWHLVIAAYNCGPGNVNKAIRRAGGKRDYWAIYNYLPKETRGYVPIFIAANYVMNYAPEHNMCAAKVDMPIVTDTIIVTQRLHLEQVADILDLPIKEVRLLNPQYKKDIIPGNIKPYVLCLPSNFANSYIDKYNEIIAYKADSLINNRRTEIAIARATPVSSGGSGKVIYHKVRSGQTLGGIALKYNVSLTKLKRWNKIKGSRIKIGQRLKIYR